MKSGGTSKTEEARVALQIALDAQKTQTERNILGQFSTPFPLAKEVVKESLRLLSAKTLRFLDPAIGTGVFYSALLVQKGSARITQSSGYDIDPHYGEPATELWSKTKLRYHIEDFTLAAPPKHRYNLLVCNPPYVRHHHLDGADKVRLAKRAYATSGMSLSGLAGLYCYFLALSQEWVSEGGISAWLIPSEFMDVNYGDAIRDFLVNRVTLLRIHRFDPNEVQFNDALVSSAVVWIKHSIPPAGHTAQFSFGGSIRMPRLSKQIPSRVLRSEHKWSRFPTLEARDNNHQLPTLGDYFTVKRGLATGSNETFVMDDEMALSAGIPRQLLRPILPSPRYLEGDIVEGDDHGEPRLGRRLFLLDCRMPPDELKRQFPRVWRYLESRRVALADKYFVQHRKVWYLQEERPPAPILCTYMGRSSEADANPFRFILNRSRATAANAYHMLYPKGPWSVNMTPELLHQVWRVLAGLRVTALTDEGRVYGGGLHKVEPRELSNVIVPGLSDLLGEPAAQHRLAL